MAAFNPAKFFREVRQEVGKVTWPTRKETMISSVMVVILVFLFAIFFMIVNSVIGWGIRLILGVGI